MGRIVPAVHRCLMLRLLGVERGKLLVRVRVRVRVRVQVRVRVGVRARARVGIFALEL